MTVSNSNLKERSSSGQPEQSAFLIPRLARNLKIEPDRVSGAVGLLDEGATIPFIARYRKEATGGLDEVQLGEIRDGLDRLRALEARREAVLSSLQERGLLSPELKQQIDGASTLAILEDLYLPYRPRKKTRADKARERGLEPLAERIWTGEKGEPLVWAEEFVSSDGDVCSAQEAIDGALDILAERVSQDLNVRGAMRLLFVRLARLSSQVKKGEDSPSSPFRDYFDFSERAAVCPSHRLLALFRGEKKGVLSLEFRPPEEVALARLEGDLIPSGHGQPDLLRKAIRDGYRRLLAPAMEREIRDALKKRAEEKAIAVFAVNVKEVLLAPPLGARPVMGVDPGFRTGCKLACLDPSGFLLEHATIYPHFSKSEVGKAEETVRRLCRKHAVEVLAVGNGTAGRETLAFLQNATEGMDLAVTMVSESGASVYSASEEARREFPDLDLTFRGAVSIGRRLQDPLAELVKIDPRSLGVGQYQHDVDPGELSRRLDDVVSSCVHAVGVNVNTASERLLGYVSGIGPALAKKIVEHRNANGAFPDRKSLKSVPRLGARAFELSGGFLRVHGGDNPLDSTGIHPERYGLVRQMVKDLGASTEELVLSPERLEGVDPQRYVGEGVGLPTLKDIFAELRRGGRDPRDPYVVPRFDPDVRELADLQKGMVLEGVVTNVTDFGAFVDVGVHRDGLIHASRLGQRGSRGVHVGASVRVSVLDVDQERQRFNLALAKGQA